jgi:hypothetical protein
MPEPIITTAIITGLVSVFKAYTEYKAAVAKQEAPPAKSEEVVKGEQAAPIITTGIAQHGDAKEQTTLQLFEDDPETYEEAMRRVLERVANRSQPFAQELRTLAQQSNIQTGGVQGTVNVSDQGKVYGTATGVNTGTISGTYTFNDHDEDKT